MPEEPKDGYINSVYLDLSHNEFSGHVPYFCSGSYNNSQYLMFKLNDNQLSGDMSTFLLSQNIMVPLFVWGRCICKIINSPGTCRD